MLHLKTFVSIVILAFSAVTNNAQAQKNDSIRNITLKARVTDLQGNATKWHLHSVPDRGLLLTRAKTPVYTNLNPAELKFVDYGQIELLQIRKKNQIAKGLGYGVLIGAILGSAIGMAGYDGSDKGGFDLGIGASAVAGGVIGAGVGGVIGVGFSIGSRRYRIKGDQYRYLKMQKKILTRIHRNKK